MSGPVAQALLAVVEQSPLAAATHDRAGWVGLFSTDGRIEDPVGSRPHSGTEQIGLFYDTFIGPRDISFRRDLDVVCGSSVIRDLDLEVAMGSAVTMIIPAFLRYDLRQVEGDWKIVSLQAYWELPAMMLQFLRHGIAAAPATLQLSRGLIRNQRLRGTVGFAAGFRRAGSRHKTLLTTFVHASSNADTGTASYALSPAATITFGDDNAIEAIELSDFVARLSGAEVSKLVAAGPTVVASIHTSNGRGVMFADVAVHGNGFRRIRYFPD